MEAGSRDPVHAHLGVILCMVHTQEGSVFYVFTKFDADCSIRSKVIKLSQNLEIRSHDPGHAHLRSFYDPYVGMVRPLCMYQILIL